MSEKGLDATLPRRRSVARRRACRRKRHFPVRLNYGLQVRGATGVALPTDLF
jgi:hypothetical protein